MPIIYATLAELKAALPDAIPSTDESYDPFLTDLLERASRLIDTETKRKVGAYSIPSTTDDTETRYFDGSAKAVLQVGEMIAAPQSVSMSLSGSVQDSDYTSIPSSDYFVLPDNAAAEGLPFTALEMDTINGAYSFWYRYRKSVKVVSWWGYSDSDNTPPDISQAVITQAARWFGRARQGYADRGANLQLNQLTFSDSLDADVIQAVMNFRRVTI